MSEGPASSAVSTARGPAPWLLGAIWSATIFGLLEGIVHAVARLDPRILAPGKVSNDILWVAPLANLLPFLAVGVLAWLAYRFGPRRLRRWPAERLAAGLFVFGGAFSVLFSPRIIGAVSAAVLALGLAVAAVRFVEGREARAAAWMRRRLAWIPVVLLVVGGAVALHAWVREHRASSRLADAPANAVNVLILLLDTVREDRFTSDRAPNLTRLAASGVSFTNAWSTTSWSLPSQASVLTGRHAFEHGADFPGIALAPDVTTLAEYLGRRGYATGAFSSNSAWITREHLGRGFVRFDAYILEDLLRRTFSGRVAERALNRLGYHKATRGKEATALTAQFLRFVDDYQDRPYFAYLCFMDVNRNMHRRALGHAFWQTRATPAEALATYDSAITALDAQIGDMLEELDRRGTLANTMIIVTSDHGESFGEGVLADHDPDGHGTSLYPEQVRVPLFIVMPGAAGAAPPIERVASIRQIPATIATALGDESHPFPGASLLRAGGDEPPAELATLDYDDRRIRSVVWDRWQYLAYPTDPQREELYDLGADPGARRNLRDVAGTAMATARASLARLHPAQVAPAASAAGAASHE